MIRVRYATTTHRPPHRVTCRLVEQKRPWTEYAGLHVDGTWVFDLPVAAGVQVVLALDGQVEGTAITLADQVHQLGEAAAGLSPAPVAVDDGRLQQEWFAEGADPVRRWDLIIIGHGMGGGVLHTALARDPSTTGESARPLQILGLEAGSLLFTGHAGNQPAVRAPGTDNFPITMWNTLWDFGTVPFANNDAGWSGREVFALGGRSLYWGAVCPRIDDGELTAHWPAKVRDDLIAGSAWYRAAEELLGVNRPRPDDIARDGLRLLDDLLPDRANGVTPVALRREKPTSWHIPGGLFSTAELLLEERLSRRDSHGYGPPYIHLAELAVRVEKDGDGWAVHGVDLRDGTPTVRYAHRVVLSCGAVESARLLAASSLPNPPGLLGQGITEHLMAWLHFEIPPGTPFCRADTSAKLLSTPGHSTDDYNILLDLGSDLNLGHTDALDWARTATSPGAVAGQLVFLGRADLGNDAVRFGPGQWLDLNLPGGAGLPDAVLPARKQPSIPDSWNEVAEKIVTALGARRLPGEGKPEDKDWWKLRPGGTGYVGHEVGTLRMSGSGSGVVDEDLQVNGQDGLFVCDNSVFPSSPAANPSLTLAALALRLADHLRSLRWS